MLRLRADHEPRHVLHEEEWNPLAVGVLDEVRHLLGTLGVDDPADFRRFAFAALDDTSRVRDERHGVPRDGAVAADHLRGAVGLELVKLPRVEHAVEHGADIVAHAVVRREQVIQVLRVPFGLAAR